MRSGEAARFATEPAQTSPTPQISPVDAPAAEPANSTASAIGTRKRCGVDERFARMAAGAAAAVPARASHRDAYAEVDDHVIVLRIARSGDAEDRDRRGLEPELVTDARGEARRR